MHFTQGKYVPQLQIIEELPKFSNENMSTKQIQQFLGILNYIRDFIPHISKHTTMLSKLLKKNAPPSWPKQIVAVKSLKQAAKNPSPLKIQEKVKGFYRQIPVTSSREQFWYKKLKEKSFVVDMLVVNSNL